MNYFWRSFLVLLCLTTLAVGAPSWQTATTEQELYQGLQGILLGGKPHDCDYLKVEGEWAMAYLTQRGGTSGSEILRKQNGRWTMYATVGGRGPVTRQGLLKAKVPSATVALFGFGEVPAKVSSAFRTLAQKQGAAAITFATYGDKYFASLRPNKDVFAFSIYEYVGGEWRYIFRFEGAATPKGLAVFREHQMSTFLGSAIISGTAGSYKL